MRGLDDGPDGLNDAAFDRALGLTPRRALKAPLTEVRRLEKALADAQTKSTKAMERRQALPPGSSRARVTTANANWARAAEHRDRISDQLEAARARASQVGGGL